jgi:hypothetical protein
MTEIEKIKILLTHEFVIHEGKILYRESGDTCFSCYFNIIKKVGNKTIYENMRATDKYGKIIYDERGFTRGACEAYPCSGRNGNYNSNWQSYYKELI